MSSRIDNYLAVIKPAKLPVCNQWLTVMGRKSMCFPHILLPYLRKSAPSLHVRKIQWNAKWIAGSACVTTV